MINELVVLAVAIAFFWLGWKTRQILDRRAAAAEFEANRYPENAQEVIDRGWFKNSIIYDCPEGHAVAGQLCDLPGVWMCLERLKYIEEMETPLFDVELGIDEYLPLDDGTWIEVEIQNDCGFGCKIYEHNKTGRRALAHNSAYGCTRSFNLNVKE